MTSQAGFGQGEYAGKRPTDLEHEAALIRAAKERSSHAWTEIYEEHYDAIFRYMQARVADRETAEDLAASVFLEALKSIDKYRHRGRPFLAWLYAIARNVANYYHRTRFRKEAGRVVSEASVAAGPEEGAPGRLEQTPSDLPGGGDPAALAAAWDLREALTRLSEDQREVIILRYFVGLTTPQTARVVGKRERAVYSLQHRAIQALRRHLA